MLVTMAQNLTRRQLWPRYGRSPVCRSERRSLIYRYFRTAGASLAQEHLWIDAELLLDLDPERPYVVTQNHRQKGITMSLLWIIVTYLFVAVVLGTVGLGTVRAFGFGAR